MAKQIKNGKCPNCGAKVKKVYVVGSDFESGKTYCDNCIKNKSK